MSKQSHEIEIEVIRDAGIPAGFWELDADTYLGCPDALRRVQEYIRRFDKMLGNRVGMRVMGETQSYKTFLMTLVLKHALARNYTVRYATLNRLTAICLGQIPETAYFEDYVTEPEVLAVDNVDALWHSKGSKEGVSVAFAADVFSRTLRLREDADKLTLFASRSEDMAQFASIYKEEAVRATANFVEVNTTANPFYTNAARIKLKRQVEDA